jgi:hypothetical protein
MEGTVHLVSKWNQVPAGRSSYLTGRTQLIHCKANRLRLLTGIFILHYGNNANELNALFRGNSELFNIQTDGAYSNHGVLIR